MTPIRVLAVSLISLLIPVYAAAELVPDNIRTTEPRLRMLFHAGLRNSETFRTIASRLDASDVVVYLQTDPSASVGPGGRLTFLSEVGGLRYVMVRVASLGSVIQQIAMIGHELQHAVEVAERPEIVDRESMFREYMRIGYVNGSTRSGVAVDTRAATEAGRQVGRELRSAQLTALEVLLH